MFLSRVGRPQFTRQFEEGFALTFLLDVPRIRDVVDAYARRAGVAALREWTRALSQKRETREPSLLLASAGNAIRIRRSFHLGGTKFANVM